MPPRSSTKRNAYPGSIVYRNLPEEKRRQIVKALTERPPGLATLAAIYRRFRLKEDYHLGLTSFKTFARRIENLKRKESVGRITSALCPRPGDADQDTLQKRGHLLLIQRIVRTLEESELPTPELCRLAQAYTAQRKLALDLAKSEPDQGASRSQADRLSDAPPKIVQLVREIYGVRLPEQ